MSDSETTMTDAPPHPTHGGKSLQSLQRPRYKSWRKKYRKMKHNFDATLEENKRLFKEEQKLGHIAKRLREELDGLLELCLDLNQTPALPTHLRYNLSYPIRPRPESKHSRIDPKITPEDANELIERYTEAVRTRKMDPIDLHVAREQTLDALAAQDVETLDALQDSVSQPIANTNDDDDENAAQALISYMTQEQEDEYLEQLDARIVAASGAPQTLLSKTPREKDPDAPMKDSRNLADLTPRELERQMELSNPQSQHNWLKSHTKALTNLGGGDDDADSVVDAPSRSSGTKRKAGKEPKTLAKQVGDRAVERAREGYSPGAGSAAGGLAEDDEMVGFEDGMSGRKRTKDADGAYRLKASRPSGGGGAGKAKRKRSGEDIGVGGVKKAKVEGE